MGAERFSAAVTRSEPLTGNGTLLGTLQYMAPEQVEGKETDARTDIFVFGAVVYEMVTGRKAFEGKSQASLIGAILKDDPQPMTALQPVSPPALDRLVQTCLAKDPEERWQTVRDVARELKWVAEDGSQLPVAAPAMAPPGRQSPVAWSVAAMCAALAIAFAVPYQNRAPTDTGTAQFSVLAGASVVSGLALSPDGRQLAFVPGPAGSSAVWVRPLDSVDARALPDTEGSGIPFWSPDGRSIGFFTRTELKTVDLTGGPSQTVSAVQYGYGGTWNDDDVIVFGSRTGLLQVPAAGGEPTPVTMVDDASGQSVHGWPQFLPDGEHVLFFAQPRPGQEGAVYVTSLQPGATPSLLLRTSGLAWYAEPGYLLFARGTSLMAQPFDVARLSVTGDPVRVADEVSPISGFGDHMFSTSHEGGLVYLSGGGSTLTQLRWVDRAGADLGTVGEPGDYSNALLSPDETRIAVERDEDIWILDLSRGTEQQFTFDPAIDTAPVWAPGGERIVFTSFREGRPGDLYVKDAAGARPERLLLETDASKRAVDWSTNGEFVSYTASTQSAFGALWLLPMLGDREPTSFLQTPFVESAGVLSPDGRWMAYRSDESGEFQVYVQRVPPSGAQRLISTDGGFSPRWRGDGRELYYVSVEGALMSVEIELGGDTVDVGTARQLFSRPGLLPRRFDVAADGQRFLVNTLVEGALSTPITWVLNWTAELDQ